ncbi:MAG: hypothetical protein K2J67_02065 [Lachnospiraceae bacterium]|nr:hypothetical protein [Lachnospiraceae bacterium]
MKINSKCSDFSRPFIYVTVKRFEYHTINSEWCSVNFTGENIDLPKEEYERFLELSNQLAETFPNIGYTIDENGNRITGLSGSIDEITQSINDLVQAQQLLTHQEISDNMKDAYKKTKEDVTNYKNEIENLKRQKTGIPDVQEKTQELLEGKKIKFHMSGPNDYTFLNDMISLFQKEGLKLQFQEGHLSLNQSAKDAELNDMERNRILSGADQIEAKYADDNNYIDQKIADLQNKIQMSMNSFSPNLTSWITTDQNYAKIVQTYGGDLGTLQLCTLLGYQSNQLEHIQNILGHSDFTLSAKDGGGLTMEGLSSVAITFRQIQNNNDLIANKSDQIAEIQRQIDNKEYVGSQEQAEEEIYNLLREIEELEEANYDFGESIKTLVIDSLNSLSDALDENISKCKDTLKVQKDLFDYRKKVVNQLDYIRFQ